MGLQQQEQQRWHEKDWLGGLFHMQRAAEKTTDLSKTNNHRISR